MVSIWDSAVRNKIQLIIGLIVVLVGGHLIASEKKSQKPSLFSLDYLWTDQDNKKVVLKDFKNKITILSMVYTTCDYSCPLITSKFEAIYNKLSKKNRKQINFVLITMDPQRDTPKVLKEYTVKRKLADKNFHFLTSSPQNTHAFSLSLGFQYKKMPNGHFSHSNQISILDKNGVLVLQQDVGIKITKFVEMVNKLVK